MKAKILTSLIVLITLGVFASPVYSQYPMQYLLNLGNEQCSPYDRIAPEQIHVFPDRIVIDLPNASWAVFSDTNSMDPVIDIEGNSLEITPASPEDVHVGDIISYREGDIYIVHRVIETGRDESGWFCITKGDNSPIPDPLKVRFKDITGIVVGIFY